MPYTLPGALALIGLWWYISRKKERPICHDSPEEASTAVGLRTSPAEGSNGLVEKGTISPTNDEESPTHRSAKAHTPQIHVQDNEIAPSLELSSEEAAPHLGRITPEHKPSDSTLSSFGKEDCLQILLKDPHGSLSPALVKAPEEHQVKDPASALEVAVEDDILSYQATKLTSSSPITAHLSDAERPEPEGEVAKHHSIINTQDDTVVCALTPAKVQTAIASEDNSLDTPSSVQDLHQHILTSTPNDPAVTSSPLSTVQDCTTTAVTTVDVQVQGAIGEEQDLELLAAGLITEVISAATQEVLGVTSYKVTDNSHPSCSDSTAFANSRLCSQQELIRSQHLHQLTSHTYEVECREESEKEDQGMPNGCASVPRWECVGDCHKVHQTKMEQSGHCTTAPHQVGLCTLKGDEAARLAEDSACSTCHSEDGISSDDLHNSLLDNQTDVMQVTDLSTTEATQHQSVVETIEATVLALPEDDSLETVCDIKKLNGMGLRNEAHVTCEVETDQSGGENFISLSTVLLQKCIFTLILLSIFK